MRENCGGVFCEVIKAAFMTKGKDYWHKKAKNKEEGQIIA